MTTPEAPEGAQAPMEGLAPWLRHFAGFEDKHSMGDRELMCRWASEVEAARAALSAKDEPVAWIDARSLKNLRNDWSTYAHVVAKCRTVDGDTPLYTRPLIRPHGDSGSDGSEGTHG